MPLRLLFAFRTRRAVFAGFILACSLANNVHGGALENYIKRPDDAYAWKVLNRQDGSNFHTAQLELVSQKWRDSVWTHSLLVVRPNVMRNPDIAFLFVTGGGGGEREQKMLQLLADRAGAIAAVVTQVPNQPLYDGRKEDALIAYTFAQYLATGDESWPLLFPMTKSAVRAMDAVQEFAQKEGQPKITRFVVGGASKRGWTTWLAGAVDPRIVGLAPMVIDMLNMRAQTDWEEKVYGHQSEMVKDYVQAGLIKNQDDPRLVQLRGWVDPYTYRKHYTMAKLLLLGTNDPYWTVDSLHNYWNDLPEPKLVFQTPNAGHDLKGGLEATQTLAAFFQMIADRQPLPTTHWQFDSATAGTVKLTENFAGKVTSARLWTATSTNRDFRTSQWTSSEVALPAKSHHVETSVETPQSGYRAFLMETTLLSPTGEPYKLSTEARVTPAIK